MKIEDIIQSTTVLSLNKKTLLNIMYTQNMLIDSLSKLLKHYDLSFEQFNLLRIVRDQEGKSVNMFVIQERMIAKTSNTTRLVDKLLLKELVIRKVCDENRRKIEIFITEKGEKLLKEIDPETEACEAEFANNLKQNELENLNFLLNKYRTIKR